MTQAEGNQVLDDVVAAEREAEKREEDASEAGPAAEEIREDHTCGALDSMSGELLIPPADEEAALTAAAEVTADLSENEASLASLANMVPIAKLDGVSLWYGRGPKPLPQTFFVEPGFRDVLIRTVRTVRSRAPEAFGDLTRITSAGAYVAKSGMHGAGRAFDHDAWTFEEVDIAPIRRDHGAPSLSRRRRYWALAAFCRSHSSHVLHGEYDAAHRDHIHQDNGAPRAFNTSSQAVVKLVQAICNEIFGQSPRLQVDGGFGPKTREALGQAMAKIDLQGDLSDSSVWTRFLRRSGRLGFTLSVT